MLCDLSSAELTDWLAYYAISPWGEERADLRSGIVSAVVANSLRGKRGRDAKPTDFMPFYRRPEMTPDEIDAVLRRALGE